MYRSLLSQSEFSMERLGNFCSVADVRQPIATLEAPFVKVRAKMQAHLEKLGV